MWFHWYMPIISLFWLIAIAFIISLCILALPLLIGFFCLYVFGLCSPINIYTYIYIAHIIHPITFNLHNCELYELYSVEHNWNLLCSIENKIVTPRNIVLSVLKKSWLYRQSRQPNLRYTEQQLESKIGIKLLKNLLPVNDQSLCVMPQTSSINYSGSFTLHSLVDVVTMQAQRVAPPDMQCKDKFLIQSTVVRYGTTEEDITSDMVRIMVAI